MLAHAYICAPPCLAARALAPSPNWICDLLALCDTLEGDANLAQVTEEACRVARVAL